MGLKPYRSGTYTAGTPTDLYNNSGSNKTITKQLRMYNADVSAVAVLLVITDASNNVIETLFNSVIPAGTTLVDEGFYVIDAGQKIRYTVTGSTLVQLSAHVADSLA